MREWTASSLSVGMGKINPLQSLRPGGACGHALSGDTQPRYNTPVMKIYTKTGDDGSTGLIGGERVRKSDRRIECCGTVDELNAALGWASVAAADELLGSLRTIQNELFVLGSHL